MCINIRPNKDLAWQPTEEISSSFSRKGVEGVKIGDYSGGLPCYGGSPSWLSGDCWIYNGADLFGSSLEENMEF